MIKIIKGAEVYNPNYLGVKDILIVSDKIAAIEDEIELSSGSNIDMEIIGAKNKIVTPGFIDSHVHITGGGGEGGFKTRTPEIMLTDITTGGITTVVGCLGTDGITRNMEGLLAKAKALEEEGISSFILTGSYRLPLTTITDDVMKDLLLIDKVIGAGEIALTDHRSSQPTTDALKQLSSAVRVGGILSGKAGIIVFHLGDGKDMLNKVFDIVENTEIPYSQFIPTHMNRNENLFKDAIRYAKAGGNIDFTTSSNAGEDEELSASRALKRCIEEGVPIEKITFTSDGQGSLPIFNDQHECIGLGIGKVSTLFEEVRKSFLLEKIPFDTCLKVITSNVANSLKLNKKGTIEIGKDADIVILNKEDLSIDSVIAMGKIMIRDKKTEVYGTFEKKI